MRRSAAALLGMLALAALARAEKAPKEKTEFKKGDGVRAFLADGREISGVFIESKPDVIWVGVDKGEIGIDPQTVSELKAESNVHSEYESRLAKLAPSDAPGRWKLALWAREKGLTATAEEAAESVIAADPAHRPARELLGHELHDGKWMTPADAMRAKGFVEHNGEWVTKDQYTHLEGIRLREDSETQRVREQLSYQRQHDRQRAATRYYEIETAAAGRKTRTSFTPMRVEIRRSRRRR